jgi:hypothetical protein
MTLSSYDYQGAKSAARMRERNARLGHINGHPLWSDGEDRMLRRAYPDYATARRELPDRTFRALKKRARTLGIQKRHHTWTGNDLAKLRRLYPAATKQELHAAFPGLSFSAIEKMANVKHIWKKKRPLRKTGNALLDAIRERARSLGYTMPDLDKEAHTRRFFGEREWREYAHPVYDCLYRAVEALGGQMLPPKDIPIPDRALPRLPLPTGHPKYWTAAEVTRLRKLYGWAPIKALVAAFPGRSFEQIKRMASRYGLRRPRPLKPIGHPLFDYLRKEAERQGYSMTELDRLARARTRFFSLPKGWRRMNYGALGRAAEALKVPVRLVWSDDH